MPPARGLALARRVLVSEQALVRGRPVLELLSAQPGLVSELARRRDPSVAEVPQA